MSGRRTPLTRALLPGAASTVLLLTLFVPVARPQSEGEGDTPPAAPVLDLTQLNRALKYLESGHHALARERLRRLAKHPAVNRRVLLSLGQVETLLGHYAEAVDALVEASRFRENDYEVLNALAEALRRQAVVSQQDGDFETAALSHADARRFFEQAARLRPTEAEPWLGVSRVARGQGDPDEALRLLVRATELEPDHVESLVELGSQRFGIYWQLKQLRGNKAYRDARDAREQCRVAYARALELDPENGLAMNGLAWVAMQGRDQDEAIDWFRKSLLADPTLTDSYDNLMRMHSSSLDQKKSYARLLGAVVTAARKFGKGDVRRLARSLSLYRRGLAHIATRDVAAMKRDLTEAAQLDDSLRAECNFQIARGLFRDNQYGKAGGLILKQAEADLDALLEVMNSQEKPREAALMARSLGNKRFKNRELNEARDLFRIAACALKDSVTDWNNYAFLCRETASYEDSYAAYVRALELDPGNPALLNDAALILHYHLHRDLERAKEMYSLAILEGERLVEDELTDSYAKDSARVALKDAKRNLERLEAGIMTQGR